MYSVFVSSYRNTHESLGELEKAVETVPTAFLILPNLENSPKKARILIG